MPESKLHAAMAVVLAMSVLHAPSAWGQAQGLRLDRAMGPQPSGEDLPTFIRADRLEGLTETELEASGNVEIRKGTSTLYADHVRYLPEDDEAVATGNVRVLVKGDEITGPRLRMRLGETLGIFNDPVFNLAPRDLLRDPDEPDAEVTAIERGALPPVRSRGDAKALRFLGPDRYRMSNARFTTCEPGQDDWFVNAEELHVDMEREVATARNFSLTFLGATTPEFPYFAFPLNNARKSGFLPPSLSLSGKNGAEVTLPYYWNIAPNYDATITPRYIAKRGVQLQTEFRYLQPEHYGVLRYETLPSDRQFDESRWGASISHQSVWTNGWSGYIDYAKVSDDDYFRDLSGNLSIATQTYLKQEALLQYSRSGWWYAYGRVQKFQVLQDPLAPIPEPYERVPQLLLKVLNQDATYLDLGLDGEYVKFDHPTLQTGSRLIAYPSIALPLTTPGAFIKPKIGWHATWYDLDDFQNLDGGRRTRSVPIASLDAGLIFERETRWLGVDWLQTLEPRLYYLYVPYRRQDDIPLFDTTIADFNYSQLFSENAFVGGDRIADANQLTVGVTSRFVSPTTGQEMLRAFIGQRYYFEDQRVTLSNAPEHRPRSSDISPILASVSGRVAPDWFVEATAQYGWDERELERLNAGVRYSPAPASVINLSYRYTNASQTTIGEISTVDLSAQWPLTDRLYGLGRINYDTNGGGVVERLLGLEYNAGCWIIRAVFHDFKTATNQETRVFFLQLELNGFSRLGSNPFNTLRRNIPGYTATNLIREGETSVFDRGDSVSPWQMQ
ncbi:MAG: LPS-assembly protein LptD [Pseudomonadota bacterium]